MNFILIDNWNQNKVQNYSEELYNSLVEGKPISLVEYLEDVKIAHVSQLALLKEYDGSECDFKRKFYLSDGKGNCVYPKKGKRFYVIERFTIPWKGGNRFVDGGYAILKSIDGCSKKIFMNFFSEEYHTSTQFIEPHHPTAEDEPGPYKIIGRRYVWTGEMNEVEIQTSDWQKFNAKCYPIYNENP